MKTRLTGIVVALVVACGAACAADLPQPSGFDARVRYVDYRKDDVTVVYVRRGAVTRIVLADDEKIVAAATGFGADCSKEVAEWCVRADVGANQIWVKPRDGATYNNLELKTDKRDYSFDFRLLHDVKGAVPDLETAHLQSEPMFRVIFRYEPPAPPVTAASLLSMGSTAPPPTDRQIVDARVRDAKPVVRNTKYSMQVLKGAQDIVPSLVFDDGRFTYFRFANNREIPTIFFISPTGEEARINFEMEGELAVVQRMGRRFVLRLGKAVVGIWNESFDSDGVPPVQATTVNGVERTVRHDLTGTESQP
jgi:type IV secretion system protein VirB9